MHKNLKHKNYLAIMVIHTFTLLGIPISTAQQWSQGRDGAADIMMITRNVSLGWWGSTCH